MFEANTSSIVDSDDALVIYTSPDLDKIASVTELASGNGLQLLSSFYMVKCSNENELNSQFRSPVSIGNSCLPSACENVLLGLSSQMEISMHLFRNINLMESFFVVGVPMKPPDEPSDCCFPGKKDSKARCESNLGSRKDNFEEIENLACKPDLSSLANALVMSMFVAEIEMVALPPAKSPDYDHTNCIFGKYDEVHPILYESTALLFLSIKNIADVEKLTCVQDARKNVFERLIFCFPPEKPPDELLRAVKVSDSKIAVNYDSQCIDSCWTIFQALTVTEFILCSMDLDKTAVHVSQATQGQQMVGLN